MTERSSEQAALARIVESAARLGVEVDEEEALQWLAAMAATGEEVLHDERQGIFGHRLSMLDFSHAELARFRAIGALVEIPERPGVQTALALSGSAAQNKIQSYPGDCDFFERVNIEAETREAACAVLGNVLREKALAALAGPTYRLIELKFGSYPYEVLRGGELKRAGGSISWSPSEVAAGEIEGRDPEGRPVTLRWAEVARDPGWCKLDWLVADPIHGQLTNASNMLDVTWQAPDGTITPLDGYLDPYFQEVYLEAESIPLFSRLARHVAANALEEYVERLEHEVEKYLGEDPKNYGKVAKRMYNIFRLTGRYTEAAFLRELFDEPATVLYQVWSLIRTLDEALMGEQAFATERVLRQADELILSAVSALEGKEEIGVVRLLLSLKGSMADNDQAARRAQAEAARAEIIRLVNTFFYERLVILPEIEQYLTSFPRPAASG